VFWVILVYFNIRNTLPKSGTFLLGHPVDHFIKNYTAQPLSTLTRRFAVLWVRPSVCMRARVCGGGSVILAGDCISLGLLFYRLWHHEVW